MPLVTAKCPCGHVFDTITGSTIADAGLSCPKCGGEAEKVVGGRGSIMAKGYDWERLENPKTEADRLELQAVLEHKAFMERTEHQRDSGEQTVIERGPNWARPFENRERGKRFY